MALREVFGRIVEDMDFVEMKWFHIICEMRSEAREAVYSPMWRGEQDLRRDLGLGSQTCSWVLERMG